MLIGGCLPTNRSLLEAGGLYKDVGEEALRGRVPMKGLIPIIRFLCGGVLLLREGFCCFTGGSHEGVVVILEVGEDHLSVLFGLFNYTGGMEVSTRVFFCSADVFTQRPHFRLLKGLPITLP